MDDLNRLYRGGRVSRTAALLGTLANIKPMLHVDDEGHLIALSKVRGRKKSISKLVDMMEERLGDWKDKNDIIFISHGDCIEDANRLKELVEERTGIQAYLIDYVGHHQSAHIPALVPWHCFLWGRSDNLWQKNAFSLIGDSIADCGHLWDFHEKALG